MTFNASKCFVMYMVAINTFSMYTLCGKNLDPVDVECDLGMVKSNQIKSNQANWSKQVDQAGGKVTQQCHGFFAMSPRDQRMCLFR